MQINTPKQKLIYFLILVFLTITQVRSLAQDIPRPHISNRVLLKTDCGDITLGLYDETPLHRDNFLKLVRAGYYDNIIFHRVISNFMIQTGDSTTRHATADQQVGEYSPDYTIEAEIRYPLLFHKRGALAAAREGDDVNPQKASSSAQFYIVYGRKYPMPAVDTVKNVFNGQEEIRTSVPQNIIDTYFKQGGTQHLDGKYTVFGEVLSGMDTVEKIQSQETDPKDRPLKDIRIIKAIILPTSEK